MMLMLFSLFLWNIPSFASPESSVPEINCIIINLEYVNCTWDDNGTQNYNYSFKSMFSYNEALECSIYHKINNVNVGCMMPYHETQRFNMFSTWLYNDKGRLMTEQKHDLKNNVKLYPPYHLSVVEKKMLNCGCIGMLRHTKAFALRARFDTGPRTRIGSPQSQIPRHPTVYLFLQKKQYEFQIRARMSSSCGESVFWSDWSKPVYWGTLNPNTDTESPVTMSVMALVLYIVGATVLLVMLSCLLVHSERLKIILIPVVPNAGRNVSKYLTALFDNYDGNVEKWLSISKDLEKGFKPNFTERACPVREYRIVSQSSSDSGNVLSIPTDMSSDYQCMQSYSSASTILGPAENPQTQAPSQVDNPV